MAGIVYLRTNKFEVKLEGITFKTRDFESLCSMDFLFPEGKTWSRQPVVGIDVMRHPRDPNNVLLLLCVGVGCLIVKFNSGDELPPSIFNFLTDKRVRFVGFDIPEKNDLFPLEELGFTKEKVDIGYLAAKILDDHKYKKYELADLARKILRVAEMIGLTQSSSFERHEQIKTAICQLFITTSIAMALIGKSDKKNNVLGDSPKRSKNFLKNLNQLPLLKEGWFKFPKSKKIHAEQFHEIPVETTIIDGFSGNGLVNNGDASNLQFDDVSFEDDLLKGKYVDFPYVDDDYDTDNSEERRNRGRKIKGFIDDALKFFKNKDGNNSPVKNNNNNNNPSKQAAKQPLKGILKCPSTKTMESPEQQQQAASLPQSSGGRTPISSSSSEENVKNLMLKRANSKGHNVSFK